MVVSLNNEDRELQIELAELQTDVQINLTMSVSSVALFVALLISFQQLSINATTLFQQYVFLIGMTLSAILGFVFARIFVYKMRDKRKEIIELKKKYVLVKT